MFPAVAVAPAFLYGADPYTWTPGMKLLQFSLQEQRWCRVIQVLNTHQSVIVSVTCRTPRFSFRTSKLGALAVLLWKLKAEGGAGAGSDTEDCNAQHPGAFPEFPFPHVSENSLAAGIIW